MIKSKIIDNLKLSMKICKKNTKLVFMTYREKLNK